MHYYIHVYPLQQHQFTCAAAGSVSFAAMDKSIVSQPCLFYPKAVLSLPPLPLSLSPPLSFSLLSPCLSLPLILSLSLFPPSPSGSLYPTTVECTSIITK